MKKHFPLVLFLLIACLGYAPLKAQLIQKSLQHDGLDRSYSVYLPASYSPGQSLPLVLNLHGIGSTSAEQILYSAFNLVADTVGCIVVYPQGTVDTMLWGEITSHWNSYFSPDVDDLGFLDRLIDQVYTDYDIDLNRVYSMGMSNGGFMCHRLACELSDRIAAIASVTGSMTLTQQAVCDPPRAVPVLQIHGTADGVVPFNGQAGFTNPVREIVDVWVNHNDCSTIDTISVPDISTNDNCTASYLHYTNCNEDSEVIFYTIENGGHTWPGSFPVATLGNTNQDFKASKVIWDFFNQHVHPDPRPGIVLPTKDLVSDIGLTISPNPFQQELRLQFDQEPPEAIRLFDVSGRLVLEKEQISTSTVLLNSQSLNSGIYVLEIRTAHGIISQKLVKE